MSDEYDGAGEALYTEADVRAAAELARAQASEVYRVALRVGALGGLSADVVLKALEPAPMPAAQPADDSEGEYTTDEIVAAALELADSDEHPAGALEALAEKLHVGKAWDESKHKRDHGKFSSTGGSGAGSDAKTAGGNKPGKRALKAQKRAEAVQAASALMAQRAKGKPLSHGEAKELLDHMAHLTHDDLRALRKEHGSTFRGERVKGSRVDALVKWARGEDYTRRRGKRGSALQQVVDYGGLDPNSADFKRFYGSMRDAVNDGVPMAAFKRGGQGLDELAAEMVAAGHISIPDWEDPAEHLIGLLRGRKLLHHAADEGHEGRYAEHVAGQLEGDDGSATFDPNKEWDDEDPDWFSKAVGHAPKGGVTMNGKHYDAGQFTPAELLAAAVDVAQRALADGTDPEDGLHALYELAHGDTVQKAWDKDKHPRDDHGRFVSKDAIQAAKSDPKKAAELKKRVTNPEQRKKLDAALEDKEVIGTKRGLAKHETAQKREKVQADRNRARELRIKLADQESRGEELNPDDLREIVPHLATMTHDELSRMRSMLERSGATFGGKRLRADRVAALTQWALDKAAGKTDAPAPEVSSGIDSGLYDSENAANPSNSAREQSSSAAESSVGYTTPAEALINGVPYNKWHEAVFNAAYSEEDGSVKDPKAVELLRSVNEQQYRRHLEVVGRPVVVNKREIGSVIGFTDDLIDARVRMADGSVRYISPDSLWSVGGVVRHELEYGPHARIHPEVLNHFAGRIADEMLSAGTTLSDTLRKHNIDPAKAMSIRAAISEAYEKRKEAQKPQPSEALQRARERAKQLEDAPQKEVDPLHEEDIQRGRDADKKFRGEGRYEAETWQKLRRKNPDARLPKLSKDAAEWIADDYDRDGKPVPAEVLADYPDLAAKYAKPDTGTSAAPVQAAADQGKPDDEDARRAKQYHDAKFSGPVRDEIREYRKLGMDPGTINSGECLPFAQRVIAAIRKKGQQAEFGAPKGDLHHVWVVANGKHYDAQHPDGVDDPKDLTFFQDNPELLSRGWASTPNEPVSDRLARGENVAANIAQDAVAPVPRGAVRTAADTGKPPKTRLQAQAERARAANPPPDPNQEFGTAREQYQAFLRYAHPDDPAQKPDPGAVAEYLSKLPPGAREKLDQHFATAGKSLAQVEAFHRARMAEATPEPTPRATSEQPAAAPDGGSGGGVDEHPRDRLGRLRGMIPHAGAGGGFAPKKGDVVATMGNEVAAGKHSVVGVSRDGTKFTIRPDRAALTEDQRKLLRSDPARFDKTVSASEVIPASHASIARRLSGIVGDADTNRDGAKLVLDAVERDLAVTPRESAPVPSAAPKPASVPREAKTNFTPEQIATQAEAFKRHTADGQAGLPGRKDAALAVMNQFRSTATVQELKTFARAAGVSDEGTRDQIGQRLVAYALDGPKPEPVPGGAPKAPDVSALKRNPRADLDHIERLKGQYPEGAIEREWLDVAKGNAAGVATRDNSALAALHGGDKQHGARHYVLERLASAAAQAHKDGDAAGHTATTNAVTGLGGTLHGAAPGETIAHDPAMYDHPEGAFSGDAVKVTRQPVTYRGALVYRGQVEPVGTGAQPPTNGSGTTAATDIDTGTRAANTTPTQAGGASVNATSGGGAEPPKVPPVASGAGDAEKPVDLRNDDEARFQASRVWGDQVRAAADKARAGGAEFSALDSSAGSNLGGTGLSVHDLLSPGRFFAMHVNKHGTAPTAELLDRAVQAAIAKTAEVRAAKEAQKQAQAADDLKANRVRSIPAYRNNLVREHRGRLVKRDGDWHAEFPTAAARSEYLAAARAADAAHQAKRRPAYNQSEVESERELREHSYSPSAEKQQAEAYFGRLKNHFQTAAAVDVVDGLPQQYVGDDTYIPAKPVRGHDGIFEVGDSAGSGTVTYYRRRADGKYERLPWLDSVGGEHEQMEAGSFAGADAFRQTGVNTRMVTIQKPEGVATPTGTTAATDIDAGTRAANTTPTQAGGASVNATSGGGAEPPKVPPVASGAGDGVPKPLKGQSQSQSDYAEKVRNGHLQNIDKRLAELGDKGGKESEALRALRSVLSDSDSARFVLDVGLTGGGRPVGLNDMIAGLLAPLDEKRYATISPPSHQMIGFAAKRHGVKIPHLFTTEQARSIAGEWGDFG